MQTVSVSQVKRDELRARMERLGLSEDDLEERFIRAGGRGGQKVNKTSSCVHLVHRPSGAEVKCSRSRSQAMNRFFARRELCDKIEVEREGMQSRKLQEIEKIRRQKRRRSRRQKERMLEEKKRQSDKKIMRRPVEPDA
jgi:peptide chain release factor